MRKRNDFKMHLIGYKLLFTALIVSFYLIGRLIPLFGVDTEAIAGDALNAENLMKQVIGGDANRVSLFALGVSPFMVASIFSSTALAIRRSDNKGNVSPIIANRITVGVALAVALIQAHLRVDELVFTGTGIWLILDRAVAILELVTGAILILWLAERNKKYGIGGQSALIFVNIIISVVSILKGNKVIDLVIPLAISYFAMCIMLLLENAEKRIPLQRIAIHNIYSDKNYMAIKLSPIGIMPVMFATAFFTIPQLVLALLAKGFPQNAAIVDWNNKMNLQTTEGIICYLVIMFSLSMFFTFIFVNPKEISDQFLKSGDSLVNVHAGKDTKRYLIKTLFNIGIFSSFMMCLCIGIPMALCLLGAISSELTMLPSTVMILTGIWCSLYQEVLALKKLDSYKPFL